MFDDGFFFLTDEYRIGQTMVASTVTMESAIKCIRRVNMFEKILYPTDFSDPSKKALNYVKKLKESGAKEVIVLHVIDEREIESMMRHEEGALNFEKELEKVMEDNAKREIKGVESELKKSGFNVKVRIERGIPFRDILKVEREEDVSLIVFIPPH